MVQDSGILQSLGNVSIAGSVTNYEQLTATAQLTAIGDFVQNADDPTKYVVTNSDNVVFDIVDAATGEAFAGNFANVDRTLITLLNGNGVVNDPSLNFKNNWFGYRGDVFNFPQASLSGVTGGMRTLATGNSDANTMSLVLGATAHSNNSLLTLGTYQSTGDPESPDLSLLREWQLEKQATTQNYVMNFWNGANYTQYLTLTPTGNLGLGTATPTSTLQIATGQIAVPAGTAAIPSYSSVGDLDTGIYFPAEDTLGISTDALQRLTVSPTGVVAINNLTPAGVVHNDASGNLSTSLIMDADIAEGTITDDKLATITTPGKVANSATTATSTDTPNAIVARDGSGNFAAGTITANLIGNVTGNLTGNVTGAASLNVLKSGDTMTGSLTLSGASTNLTVGGTTNLQALNVNGNFQALSTTFFEQGVPGVQANVLQVTTGAISGPNQFNSVATAVSSITTNSSTNPFIVQVGPGVFVEPTITLKPFVSLVGYAPEETIIQASNPAQNVIVGSVDSSVSNITFTGATNTGAAAVVFSGGSGDNFVLDNCIFGSNDILVNQTATVGPASIMNINNCTVTTLSQFTTGISLVADGAIIGAVYIDGLLLNPLSNALFSQGIFISGPASFGALRNITIIGSDITPVPGNAILVQNGASVAVTGSYVVGFTSGLWVPNVGAGPFLSVLSLFEDFNTEDVRIDNPATTGSLEGTFNRAKVFITDSALLSVFFLDPINQGTVTVGPLFEGLTFDQATNISTQIQQGSTIGVTTDLSDGPMLSNAGGLNVTAQGGSGYLMAGTSPNDYLQYISWDTQTIAVPANASSYIWVDVTGTVQVSLSEPNLISTISLGKAFTGPSTIAFLQEQVQDATHLATDIDYTLRDGIGPVYENGSLVSVNGFLQLNVTPGRYFFGSINYNPSGGTAITWDSFYQATGGGENIIFNVNAVDYQNYDNGSGTLAPIPANEYARHAFYVVNDGANEQYMLVYGQVVYPTLIEAQNGTIPPEPGNWNGNIALIASIIVENTTVQADQIAQINDERPRLGFKASGVSVITCHSDLSCLLNDDHPQYLLDNGQRTMTGNLPFLYPFGPQMQDSVANYVEFAAPNLVNSSYTLVWPVNTGLVNQVLTTDGSGNLSWTTPPGNVTQGGNSFGLTMVLGTTDNNGLNLITDNVNRVQIANTGGVTINTPSTGTGLTINGGGLTVAAGGVIVSAGGANITGGLTSSGTTTLSALTTGVVQSNSSGVLSTSNGTNGQVFIAATGSNPSFISPTAGNGLSITSNATTLEYALSTPVSVANGGTGATTLTGVLIGNGTSAVTGNPITQYDVLVGGASNTISSIAPSVVSGVPLISNGSAANPSFGTVVVAGGGTGVTSFTANELLASGTTTTGSFQQIAPATAGYVLVSNGAGSLPTFQSLTINGVVLNGGNTFGENMTIGTNDDFALTLETNGTPQITIAQNGLVTISNLASTGVVHTDSSGDLSTSLIVNADISSIAAIADSKLATISTAGKVANSATTASTTSSPNTIVLRDASGNFAAGTITATFLGNLTGNVTGSASLNVLKSGDTMTGNLVMSNQKQIQLAELLTNGVNYAALQSPALLSSSYTLTLPTTAGSSNQVLTTDGTGVLSWQTVPSTTTSVTQGGNSFGTAMIIGELDNFGVNIITNGSNALQVSNTGTVTINGLNSTGVVHTDSSGDLSTSLIVNADISSSAAITDNKLATISSSGKVANSATTATNLDTASTIVARDASGNFSAGTITANLTGVASLNLPLSGGTLTGSLQLPAGTSAAPSLNFTGSPLTGLSAQSADTLVLSTAGNNSLQISNTGVVTIANLNSSGVVHTNNVGLLTTSLIVNNDIDPNAAITDTKLATIVTAGKVSNSATTATSTDTANAIVARDGLGNFSAGTITASLNGNATTATSAGSFSGNLSGDVTGTQSATVVAFVGGQTAANVASATVAANGATSANVANAIVKRDGSGNFSASTITGQTGLVASAGNITATSGNIIASAGALQATAATNSTGLSVIGNGTANAATITADSGTGGGLLITGGSGSGIPLQVTAAAGTGNAATLTGNASSPTLSITSNAAQNSIVASAGTAAIPAYSFIGSTSTGLYSPGTNQVALSTNGVNRLAIGSAGAVTLSNLGIGVVQSSAAGLLSSSAGANGQLLIGAGTSAAPVWANLTSTGGTVTITNGAGTINLETSGATANSFPTDSGTATPSSGALTIHGGSNINTSGASSTVTINLNNSPSVSGSLTAGTTVTAGTGITSTTGNIVATAGQVNAGTTMTAGTGITATTGNITASSGNIVASSGALQATAATNSTGLAVTGNGTANAATITAGSGTGGGLLITGGSGAGVPLQVTAAAGTGNAATLTGNASAPTLSITSNAAQNSIVASAGTAAIPAYSFIGSTSTGIYSPAANQVALSTNGVSRLAIGSTGGITLSSLGIGIVQASPSGFLSSSAGANGQLLIGAGTSAAPVWANITSTGGTVTITNGAGTINLETSGATANSFVTGSGTATPSLGVLDVPNGSNIATTGSGNTLTINLVSSPSVSGSLTAGTGITSTTGNIVATAGQVNAGTTMTAGTGITATTGNITASSGNIVASSGELQATAATNSTGLSVTGNGTANAATITAGSGTGGGLLITGGSGAGIPLQVTAAAGTGNAATLTGNASAPTLSITSNAAQNSIVASAGTAAIPAYSFIGSTSTGMYSPGTNQLALSTNGVNRLAIGATGAVTLSNLGIGIVQSSAAGLLSSSAGANGQLLIGAGTSAAPVWANITSTGGTVAITNGAGTINLETSGATANSFPTDSGTATPSSGALTIHGGSNINTSGAGSTVTINLNTSPSVSGSLTAGKDCRNRYHINNR